MKKGTSFFTVISIMCLVFCTCNISLEDTDLMRKPDIYPSSKQVTLTIHKINSSTDYINVFRSESGGSEITCGLIYTKDHPNATTYPFSDTLIKEGKKYKYRVRYHDSKGYYYSAWTDELKIQDIDAYNSSAVLTYTDSGAKFSINTTDYTISLTSALTAPTVITDFDKYIPMLIATAEGKTQLFELNDDFISATDSISLQGILPLDFMDRDIAITGILAQKKEMLHPDEADESKKIMQFIRWTEPLELAIQGKRDNIVNIPSQSGQAGLDYRTAQ